MAVTNKFLKTMVIILAIIAIISAGAVYFLLQNNHANKQQSIDDIIKVSVDVKDITTNLATNNYVKMSFKIQTDSKAAKEELTKRDFQVRNIIIEQLADTKASDLQGKAGIVKLEDSLRKKINQIMQDGQVVKVYITDSLLQ